MSIFALYLDDVGPNRAKVLQVLKGACNSSFRELKSLLELARPRLLTGPKWQLLSVQQLLHAKGARASIEFYPEGLDVSAWAARVSTDRIHCSACGAKLFFAVPKLTTREQIVDFARSSVIANASEIASSGWIHPGVYCPCGCVTVMANFDDIE
ncbi:Uncharacterized protein OS=Pseudomonas alcaligenes OT 69 GN=L682_00900 PE=4 SV=1 [Tuwongella immobilis]|uniref:Uncharacterized protein n=2 Tax=Tuwongella immobilis TaxID=692036 RepID=A0A6C2YI90_9BACT|nr:Uncharacterized protein OS=Pseudomonas alcaligenes OT 69 GN=L682_00900 PE=4 SV=1 [Tuwongella immobilis]VTR96988.1 Uncharacterized protein OS=Pseudomonas alcaligenes OT 69 GN=L682_00900 PE=4 SV=1 [Tuwongella immobilis]